MIESFKFFKKKKEVSLTDIVDTVFYSLIDLVDDGYELRFKLNDKKGEFAFNYINNKIVFKDTFYNRIINEYGDHFLNKKEIVEVLIIKNYDFFKLSDIEDFLIEAKGRVEELGTKCTIISYGISFADVTNNMRKSVKLKITLI